MLLLNKGILNYSGVAWDADALTLFAKMGTQPTDALKLLINKTFVDLKTADIYNYLLQFQKCNIHNETDAKLNWINTNFNLVPVGSPTYTVKKGWLNAANKYLKSGFNCAIQISGGSMTVDSFGIAIDRSDSPDTKNYYILNGTWDGVFGLAYRIQFTNPSKKYYPYSTAVILSTLGSYTGLTTLTTNNGFFSCDKGGSPVRQISYTNGVKTGEHIGWTSYPVTGEIWFGSLNGLTGCEGDSYMRTIILKKYLGATKELALYNICKYFNDNVDATF